jgi:hypothetical protein
MTVYSRCHVRRGFAVTKPPLYLRGLTSILASERDVLNTIYRLSREVT